MISKSIIEVPNLLPERWQLFLHHVEDINYKTTYNVSFCIKAKDAASSQFVNFNLCTRIHSEDIINVVSNGMMLGTTLFGMIPEDEVIIINTDGEVEKKSMLQDLV